MRQRSAGTPVGVILAAGSGVRLGSGPKPLARLGGTTLLERATRTLKEAGVERVVVVVGHAKDEVEQFVAARGLDVELVENEQFALGNGSSALVGGRAAGGRFLVVMVDHVFDAAEVARVLATEAPFVAAVDSSPRFCDVAEATKVRLRGGCVVAVGRELDPYDAVDAGIFACDAEVLGAAERCLAAGEGSWNAVKRRFLAEGREILAVDLEGAFWVDVDTQPELRRAERLLVERAAGKTWDGFVSRHLNRHLSRPLTRLLVRVGISPNAVTLIAFVLTLVAATLLALGTVAALALVAGGVLVQAASIVDGVDGEVARASLRTSRAGDFLDTVLDRVGDAAVVAGLAVAAGLHTATSIALAAALFGSLQVPFVKASYRASFGVPLPAPPSRIGFGRDARLLLVALAAVTLQPFWGLVAVAVLANLEAARRFAVGWRSRPDRPRRPTARGFGRAPRGRSGSSLSLPPSETDSASGDAFSDGARAVASSAADGRDA